MWIIFKVFTEFVTILLPFCVWFFGPGHMWDLRPPTPPPGIKPTPLALEGKVLTTGPPGKSPRVHFKASSFSSGSFMGFSGDTHTHCRGHHRCLDAGTSISAEQLTVACNSSCRPWPSIGTTPLASFASPLQGVLLARTRENCALHGGPLPVTSKVTPLTWHQCKRGYFLLLWSHRLLWSASTRRLPQSCVNEMTLNCLSLSLMEHFIPDQPGGKWNSQNINFVQRNPYCHHQFPLSFLIFPVLLTDWGFPCGSSGKDPPCLQCERPGFDPWVGEILWRRKGQPIPVFSPEESHGQRSLADYSPWGPKELDTTE